MNITDLLEGETAVIKDCYHKRLMEHGFVEGTPVKIYTKGDWITSVFIRGARIACRNAELKTVTVKYDK